MSGTSRHAMRFVLLILVAQIVALFFLSAISQNANTAKDRFALHTSSPAVTPLLLKEKEETDTSDKKQSLSFFTLIDFSNLPRLITKFHSTKFASIVLNYPPDHHPPLYSLHGVFLI